MLNRHQQAYFDKTIKIEAVKKAISSPREYEFQNILADLNLREGIDYVHQYACAQEEDGLIFVADFGFPKEKIIIELDGESHKNKKQIEHDKKRDRVFQANDFEVFRIKVPLTEYQGIFWKHFLEIVINQKRALYE